MKTERKHLYYTIGGVSNLVMWTEESVGQYENFGGKDKVYGSGGEQYLWGRVRLM
jgi:hypothetical protein